MRRKFFGKTGYAVTGNFCGLFDLDGFDARTILEDLGFLRAHACFEVMEAKGTKVFHEDSHLDRLVSSMRFLRLPLSPKIGRLPSIDFKNFFKKALNDVLLVNGFSSSLVRVIVTGGHTYDGFHPSGPANLYILVSPFSAPRLKTGKELKLKIIPHLREFSQIKTTNYCLAETILPYFTFLGYDDVLYSYNNRILETSTANFFVVNSSHGKKIITTPKENILPGVTREIVLEIICKRTDYILEEGNIFEDSLVLADEAFVTSTTRFVWPISKIRSDYFRKLMPVGPVALELRKKFLEYRKKYYSNNLDKK